MPTTTIHIYVCTLHALQDDNKYLNKYFLLFIFHIMPSFFSFFTPHAGDQYFWSRVSVFDGLRDKTQYLVNTMAATIIFTSIVYVEISYNKISFIIYSQMVFSFSTRTVSWVMSRSLAMWFVTSSWRGLCRRVCPPWRKSSVPQGSSCTAYNWSTASGSCCWEPQPICPLPRLESHRRRTWWWTVRSNLPRSREVRPLGRRASWQTAFRSRHSWSTRGETFSA